MHDTMTETTLQEPATRPDSHDRSHLTAPSGETGLTDVAVNIFAKPFQTALSLLSLLTYSGRHIGRIYLQFEPAGSRYDSVSPYLIADYLRERLGDNCLVFQPEHWIDLEAADPARLGDASYRLGIRYQFAFEHSDAPRLFLMHNDVLVYRDILGALGEAMGEAFAVGELGQCWNCPAGNRAIMEEALGREACAPEGYADFRPSFEELCRIYALARRKGIFARPYDEGFTGIFDTLPWPLPECRINEWACLLNMRATREHTLPFGPALPPGAYRKCGPICLDIGVEWFRAMHSLGLRAKHVPLSRYLKHWVGTGKVTERLYRQAEDNALHLLRRNFPAYLRWLSEKTGQNFGIAEHPYTMRLP